MKDIRAKIEKVLREHLECIADNGVELCKDGEHIIDCPLGYIEKVVDALVVELSK